MSEPLVITISEPRGLLLKARLKWAALAAGCLLLAAAAAPWTFSKQALREEIAAQIKQTTGLITYPRGRSTIAILPYPHIKIDEIGFADPSGGIKIEAESLRGTLRILPLFAGRLEIVLATLANPDIHVDLDKWPLTGKGAIAQAAQSREPTAIDETRLGIVTLMDGRAQIKSNLAGLDEQFSGLNLTLDWRNISAPASLTGQANWRGETGDVAAWVARPPALLRGEQTAVTLRIKGPALSLSSNGNFSTQPKMQFDGRIVASAPSLDKLLQIAGIKMPLPGPFENLTLSADASLSASGSALSTLRLKADGNEYEGAIAMRMVEQRPMISGTVATNLLSLTPLLSDWPHIIGADGQWSREPIDSHGLNAADIDLRVSASRARFGRVQIDDAAFSLLMKNGRMEIALGEAKAYKGLIKGRVAIVDTPAGMDVRVSGVLSGVDAGALIWDATGAQKISGTATGNFQFEGSGDNYARIMSGLDGRAQLALAQGEIYGLDIEQALRRVEKRPLSSSFEVRNGRTAFDTANISVRVSKGDAVIEEGKANGPGSSLTVAGTAQLGDRNLSLNIVASQPDVAGRPKPDATQFRFDIIGPWDEPALVPDAEGLIKRSGAAAPLLIPKAPPIK